MDSSIKCPICREPTLTAAQVERHIEDAHDLYNSNRTSEFKALRKTHLDKRALEVHRLETKMGKLLLILSQLERENEGLKRFFLDSTRRDAEQRLVAWEPESVSCCRICNLKFSYFARKHHCRLCGKVVCGDMDRNCSREVHSSLLGEKLGKPVKEVFMVRICEQCRNTMFGHQNFISECEADPPRSIELWKALKRRKVSIKTLLPQFQQLVEEIAKGTKDPATLVNIKSTRTQLYSCLAQFDQTAKKLLHQENNETATETRVRQTILLWATDYLQQAMAPLQAVPQVMQSQEKPRLRKDEAQQLQNNMVVLQEQLFMVQGMVDAAKKRRRFDELPPLEQSASDLQQEIDALAEKLGNLAPSSI